MLECSQPKKGLFNKSLMMNVGFLLAEGHFDYFVFHDVDMVGAQERRETREHTRIIILAREERLMIYIYIYI